MQMYNRKQNITQTIKKVASVHYFFAQKTELRTGRVSQSKLIVKSTKNSIQIS